MSKEVQLDIISVTAELDEIGWDWEPAGDDEVRVKCPAHEDENPSCGINVKKRLFKCQVPTCKASGDFVTFLGLALKEPSRRVVIEYLSRRYDFSEATKAVDPSAVERWHTAVWSSGPLIDELRKRGVDDQTIRDRRLGFDGKRITIPILNERGVIVNVRKYLPGAPGPEKMRNMRGHGEIRLFPLDQLEYDTVIVAGGEVKALVALGHMNPLGVGVLTATAGEGNWEPEFSRRLRGKRVFTLFDVDDEGQMAAGSVAARIKGDARWVGDATPGFAAAMDRDRYPKGDLNDFFGPEARTGADLMAILDRTVEWKPKPAPEEEQPTEVPLVHLSELSEARHAGSKVATKGVVAARDEHPYLVPGRVIVTCDRAQPGCSVCPVFARTPSPDEGGVVLSVHPESPGILQMIDAPVRALREATREALRIPTCKVVEFKTLEHYNVEDVRVAPQLEIGSRARDDVERRVFHVGHGLETNVSYRLEGRTYPHPRDQHAVFLASKGEQTEDTLQQFQPTEAELLELSLFQPTDWTVAGVQEKLDDLYSDLEANVTRIYQRRDLHLTMDLAWHSVLTVPYDRREVKGWVEVLIAGDSGQGKTETADNLLRHYGVGEKAECKGSTRAGLKGGLEQIGGRWFIRWGTLPTHDRRLVILEELKGLPIEVIGQLTDMRSSGVAEVNAIEKRRAHARTRIIALSNARGDKSVAKHSFGIEVVKQLIGGLEDIRRFDMALLVARSQVAASELNVPQSRRPAVQHRHSSELCRRLVLWAWTRDTGQVTFTEDATNAIVEESTRLCGLYTDAIPLVDRGSMRLKLARMSAALAVRTFSCANRDPRVLVVRPCHVGHVSAFIDRVYADPTFGYRDFSRAVGMSEELIDEAVIQERLIALPFPSDFVQQLLAADEVELRDIGDWCGWDRDSAQELLSFLVRKHALLRDGRGYHKSPPFIAALKKLRDSGLLEKLGRPKHVEEREM